MKASPILVTAFVLVSSTFFAGCDPESAFAKTKESQCITLTAANTEVVIAPGAPKPVRFAAEEMTNFLSRALGGPVKIVDTAVTLERDPPVDAEALRVNKEGNPSSSDAVSHRVYDGHRVYGSHRVHIVLGTNSWSAAAGVHPEKLPRDSFIIKTTAQTSSPSLIFIAGCDDPNADIWADWRAGRCGETGAPYERATIFAVYDFLERYAGCRFYFPGPLGEIVPEQASITVPCGEVRESPAFVKRMWGLPGGPLMDDDESGIRNVGRYGYIQMLRQRRFAGAPLIHGFRHFQLKERFGKTHPEYFALRRGKNGRTERLNGSQVRGTFICWSSGVLDELYADFKAYLTGQTAASRGYTGGWPKLAYGNGRVSFWPDDGFNPCECDACRKRYSSDKRTGEYATELVWEKTAEIARRLQTEGVPGMIEQGIYTPYGDMPKIQLPSNVISTYCCNGPWDELNPPNRDRHVAMAKKWFEKAGGTKLFLHNWACKCGAPDIPDLPSCSPHACGSYYARIAPYANGVYLETVCDRSAYMMLTTYITAKVTWNPKFDYEAAIDEHYRLMYGPAAPEMKAFFDDCERLWVGRVMTGRTEMTALGPMQVIPDRIEIWRTIYTEEKLKEWSHLFAEAERKVGGLNARRVALMKRNVFDPIVAARKKFADWTDAAREEARRKREGVRNLLDREYAAEFHMPEGKGKGTDHENRAPTVQKFIPFHFETNSAYRISFYIETENVKPQSNYLFNGALVGVWCERPPKWHFTYGNRAILGSTFGRIAQSAILRTGPVFESDGLYVWLRGSTGRMKVDGLIVEKVEAGD